MNLMNHDDVVIGIGGIQEIVYKHTIEKSTFGAALLFM